VKQEIIFGLHAVQALLKTAPQRAEELLVLRGRDDQRVQKITQQIRDLGIPVRLQTRAELDALCDGNHQGVALLARPGKLHDEHYLWELLAGLSVPPFLLILDGVTDPHNLGACLRSADAAGVQAVIVPKDNSAGMNETVRKVACGAAETVPLIPVTNLARTMKQLQDQGIWIVGTAGEAKVPVFSAPFTGPLAVVMGAEGAGMRRLTREHCDHLVYIPMAGSVSSLNVSVATGICLFEAVRQRQSKRD
jgi:23S rRNA (guanosine2251-2'-O)-methyltransferase